MKTGLDFFHISYNCRLFSWQQDHLPRKLNNLPLYFLITKVVLWRRCLFCSLCSWGCGGFGRDTRSSLGCVWVTRRQWLGRGAGAPDSSSSSCESDDSKEFRPFFGSLQKLKEPFVPTSEENVG